ncbi:MAG: hypothetical protein E7488_06990 [Ruminococcaceae bacterium]|nr:hypothetical protein [Oscillospiraceae bacterium]
MFVKTLTILAVVGVTVYLLYTNGYITIQNKKALMFVGKHGFMDKRCSAKFSSCTGRIKKIIIFKENRPYRFNLNCTLEKGEIKVTVRNTQKQDILVLTPEKPDGVINPDIGKYYLEIEIYKAYGSYELTWK